MLNPPRMRRFIHGEPTQIGEYVLLPGDPGRVMMLADHLESGRMVSQDRAFTAFTGYLGGVPVSIVSTGMGGPSIAIAMEELIALGAHTFIRVGTSGILQPQILSGDLVIVAGAVRDEGTARQYLPQAFPAAADLEVIASLRDGCEKLGLRHWTGIVHSKDSLYGEWEPDRMPIGQQLVNNYQAWQRAGVLCSEMEMASLLVVAAVYHKRAGGLIVALNDDYPLTELCQAAVEGLRQLIARDQRREDQDGDYRQG